MKTSIAMYVDLGAGHEGTVSGRARRTLAPTPFGVRGGAVSVDGFTLARDSARTWNPMS